MKRHFHEEMKELKQTVLKMGLMVEKSLHVAVEAIQNRDAQKAEEVLQHEKEINQYEIEIDSKGHDLLALEQPLAIDLRRLTMILKINTDLERMGDHAVNIAERCIRILKKEPYPIDPALAEMAQGAKSMLRRALDAFINEDEVLAKEVLESDDEVDQYNRQIGKAMRNKMGEDTHFVPVGVNLMMAAYDLERVADLASNIAEDVIYIKQGKEVKHHIDSE